MGLFQGKSFKEEDASWYDYVLPMMQHCANSWVDEYVLEIEKQFSYKLFIIYKFGLLNNNVWYKKHQVSYILENIIDTD